MAKNKSTVYLGYEDEEICVKHTGHSTLNKIGGTPDWPLNGEIKVPPCSTCGSARSLIVQLYAPLELSQFHRTLYIFSCLNPICSQSSKGWLCIRTQYLDQPNQADIITAVASPGGGGKKKKTPQQLTVVPGKKIAWCSGADDWGEVSADGPEEMDTTADECLQQNEENGNVVDKNDNSPLAGSSLMASDAEDDDEDESTSMENDLICGFGQLDMHSPNSVEDPNANCAGGVGAAAADEASVVNGATATLCAEIEGSETDVVFVETPKKPERDLIALLKHTSSSAAIGPLTKITDVTLKPFYMSVDIEQRNRNNDCEYTGDLSADHIRELYQEYKRADQAAHSPSGGAVGGSNAGGAAAAAEEQEIYENVLPAHGDLVFHQFITTIQQNPGQILRYSRDAIPILIAPLAEPVPKCQNCNGETICEVQILSTLIPKLLLQQSNEPAPIEYGNVLVFTCLKCCWDTPDKMRYERIIVQAEK